jgi:hypothetical protein
MKYSGFQLVVIHNYKLILSVMTQVCICGITKYDI